MLFSPCNGQSFEPQYQANNDYKTNFKSSSLGFSKRVSSPETNSLESNSHQVVKVFTDDWELYSPFSVVSSHSIREHALSEQSIEQDDYDDDDDDDDEDDDEFMSSYVIEINSNLKREDCEASNIDEAIAWAKERFQSQSSDKESSTRNDGNGQTGEIKGILTNKKVSKLTHCFS